MSRRKVVGAIMLSPTAAALVWLIWQFIQEPIMVLLFPVAILLGVSMAAAASYGISLLTDDNRPSSGQHKGGP